MKTSCVIQTSSHRLSKNAFEFLNNKEINLCIEDIREHSFILSWDVAESSEFYTENFEYHSHINFSCFIAAINIASLGLFTWGAGLELKPIYGHFNSKSGASKLFTLNYDHLQTFEDVRDLTKEDIDKTIKIYIILCREEQSFIRSEYLKGILHLSVNFYDINYHREAFFNYYRCLEYLVTRKILKLKKLSNEYKQITGVLKSYGLNSDLLAEFKSLYSMRCCQIMHSQNEQHPITYDNVIKMKVFAELILNKFYIKKANDHFNQEHNKKINSDHK